MEKEEEKREGSNWTEAVEDLVAAGDIEAAVSLLESVVSQLQTSNSNKDSHLAAALTDLSRLYSSQGFSLKADKIATEALLLKQQTQVSRSCLPEYASVVEEHVNQDQTSASSNTGNLDHKRDTPNIAFPCDESLDDDWETLADRSPNDLFSSQGVHRESETPVKDIKDQTTRRRGRGTFSYKKDELYSDKLSLSDNSNINDVDDNDLPRLDGHQELKSYHYGTQHVLVLADFPPSTKTIDLERLLDSFNVSGFVIRWINDTVALAVFQTPSAALEALGHVRCPFTVRTLHENDTLLSSIPPKDLEPPRQRPKTSARTAQRLIAQGMGLKLPSTATGFGSRELRKQEEDRRNRIFMRQKLKDEAWGAD